MSIFNFKHFSLVQQNSSMKIGTDSMVLGALVSAENPTRILDVGAGTGVLSLMMAQKFGEAMIEAIELDSLAFKDCQQNFANSPWPNRLFAISGNFLDKKEDQTFDLIITNPPFFENSLKNPTEGKALARHTDALPLELLLKKVSKLLREDGSFWVILPWDQTKKIIAQAEENRLFLTELHEVLGKPNSTIRTVFHFKHQLQERVIQSSFLIRDEKGNYSEQYKKATIDFHDRLL